MNVLKSTLAPVYVTMLKRIQTSAYAKNIAQMAAWCALGFHFNGAAAVVVLSLSLLSGERPLLGYIPVDLWSHSLGRAEDTY